MTGIEWTVERIVRVTDGDTVRLVRRRTTLLDDLELSVRDTGADGIPVRLAWVDTPERGRDGYHEARADLVTWLAWAHWPLRVVCYSSAGWDRILGDLIDAYGNSASQWLMTEGNAGAGWPPYLGGRS